eukprot:6188574-Pleurochrysis_carterae.AAC.1
MAPRRFALRRTVQRIRSESLTEAEPPPQKSKHEGARVTAGTAATLATARSTKQPHHEEVPPKPPSQTHTHSGASLRHDPLFCAQGYSSGRADSVSIPS